MINTNIAYNVKRNFGSTLGLIVSSQIFFSKQLFAAGDAPLLSLNNTDFVVLIAFLAFVGLLIYLKVPGIISSLLDQRANSIREEIDDANRILEEAKSLLADLEREHKINIEKAEQVISDAENEAKALLSASKKEIRSCSIRKLL